MTWQPTVSSSGVERVLAADYLQARGDAFDRREHMDVVVADFLNVPDNDTDDVLIWLAFMAGSDWERTYRGRRYADESTSV